MKYKRTASAIIFMAFLFLYVFSAGAQEAVGQEGGANSAEIAPAQPSAAPGQQPAAPGQQPAAAPGQQPAAASPDAQPAPVQQPLTDEQKRIEMDLNTSTLPELAAWCRSLGLSEGGDVNTLKNSLRAYFKMPSPSGNAQDDKRKIITINSARTTEYFKIDAVDEDYARLTGDVQVMLKDGDTTHEFSAWDVLFNRTRNIITAKGNVEYKRTEGDKIETFRGDSITVDLDNWESIFLGGVSERSLASDNTTYLFSGTVISKDEEDVTILTKGSISGATSPDSLWSLTASRIWLLPGSDFAILNAVLKVGEIPVLYIPFFYFPADEVVFHPVIGSRNREGNFIQTTTYLLGNRSSASSVTQSSLTKILGNSNDMEKKREGLFLRSTGKKADNTSGANLSLMLDYYTNLGAFAGINLLTPKLSIFNPITFNAGLGFSRTIVLDGGNYTPFAPKYDGSSDWNKSTFLSFEVPFRYRFNFNSGITGTLGSLTWDIPYYSDPWMDSDFMNRAEDMDWVNMIQQGAALEAENTSDITMTTYTWRLSGNLNPKFPNMSPFISNISIGALSSSIGFNSKIKNISSSDPAYYSPSRAFYYPNSATLYSAGFTVTGNPLSLGGGSGTGLVNSWTPDQPKEGAPDPLAGIGVPVSPWESGKKEDQQVPKDTTTLIPPVLSQRFEPRKIGSTQVGFSYSVNPMSTSELQFDSSKWNNYNDIDWNDVESVLSSFSANANTAINFSQSDGLYSGSFTFGGNGAWRQFSYIDDKATKYVPTASDPNPAQTARIQQYKSNTFFTTNYGLNTTVSPLFLSNTWKGSNLTYSLSGLAVKSGSFIGTADAPKWKIDYGEWNKDKITTHSLTAQLAANVLDKNQSLSVSADLPPRDSRYSANAAFNVWITNTTASMQVRNVEDEKKRKLDPFNFYETLKFGNYATVNYTMILDTEKRQFTTISTTLSTASNIGLSAGYTASRISGYKLDPTTGWIASNDKPSLKSTTFNLNYYKSFINNTLWNNRFNFTLSVNPRLNFDLQRFSTSSFSLSLQLQVVITEFLNVTMSYNALNSVIYRYYRGLLPDLPASIRDAKGEQYNVFTDLLNSFRFDDENRRRSSGFKMQSFSLSTTHRLGDWDANMTLNMAPYLPDRSQKYKLRNDFQFVVQWRPISEIKTDMSYNNKDDKWIIK